MSANQLVIQNGRVIDPASGYDEISDVLIEDGRIISIGPTSSESGAPARRFDASGCIVAPGLIDPHVHLREPSKSHDETIATGAASAINGGFTTIACMPNTQPTLDSPEMVRYVQSRAAEAKRARVFVVGAATEARHGEMLAPIGGMAHAGALAFSDDGDVVANAGIMEKVLRTVKSFDRAFMQHCQEPSLTRGGVMNAGPLATRLGLKGWPAVAEELIIERDIRLNRRIGADYHVQHVSGAGSVDIIRRARDAGQPVTAEASPHHLLLTEDTCAAYDPMAKMNPPLRTARDVEALKQGIADGVITILATDHAPHPLHTKQTDFTNAAFGIVGLDCALPLYAEALIAGGVVDWPEMLAMMTIHPAHLLGLDRMGLGRLTEGGPADVTIIDPDHDWTIEADRFASTGRNCPFDGREAKGRAIASFIAGRIRLDRESKRHNAPTSGETAGRSGAAQQTAY